MIIELVANFFAGVFLCNSIPHLAAGLRGELFPSPFAKPPGVGNSRPFVNVLWGGGNAVVGGLIIGFSPIAAGMHLSFLFFILGMLSSGCYIATYFERIRNSNK